MTHSSVRGLRGLVPSLLRSLSLASLALGGIIASAPAHAATKSEGPFQAPAATIVDVNIEDGALTARILWSEDASPEQGLRLVSLDGKDGAGESVDVKPQPGKESEVKLFGAVKDPWETGWSRKLVLQDAKGQAVSTRPYDVTLDCESEDKCGLVATMGTAASEGVVRLSEDLDEAIKLLREKTGDAKFDLVGQVSEAFPELRGEALVYAHQLALLKPTAGPCNCSWQMVKGRSPAGGGYSLYGSAHLSSRSGWNGEGAKHWMSSYAQGKFLSSVHEISGSADGNSNLTLRLSCSQLLYTIDKWVTVFNPDGSMTTLHIVQPVYGTCTSPCQARFDHQGRITGRTYINGDNRPGNRAIAEETGRYAVDGVYQLNHTVTQGGSFDNIATRTVYGYGSTGRVESHGYTRAVGRWESATASVNNGHSLAIHATASCMADPYKEVATWDYGSTIDFNHEQSLRQTIKSFFWQWYIPVNP